MKYDLRLIVTASSAAQKATAYVLKSLGEAA